MPATSSGIHQRTFFHKRTTSLKALAFGILVSLSCTFSVLHLVAISIDRSVAVVFPLRCKIFMKKSVRTVSLKLTFRMEFRVACTLAIAKGTFTVCWFPILIVFETKRPKITSPLHKWRLTLARLNSAMNFLIYSTKMQAPVVQTSDSAIHRINLYPVDSAIGFHNTYPLDSDLSGG